jgi:hypothetical protein
MKKLVLILSLLSVSFFYSCKKNLVPLTLGIDIQSSFNQDNVQVFIDGHELLHKQLQTNPVLGVCYQDGQITTTGNMADHEIKVIVNNSATKTETFSLQHDLYIGVNYDPQTNLVSLVYSNQRFLYD